MVVPTSRADDQPGGNQEVVFQVMAFQSISRAGHLPGGCDGRIDQQAAAPQLDRCHAHVDVHICA